METIKPSFESFSDIRKRGRMEELISIISDRERKLQRSSLLILDGSSKEEDVEYFRKYMKDISTAREEYETLKRRINE